MSRDVSELLRAHSGPEPDCQQVLPLLASSPLVRHGAALQPDFSVPAKLILRQYNVMRPYVRPSSAIQLIP